MTTMVQPPLALGTQHGTHPHPAHGSLPARQQPSHAQQLSSQPQQPSQPPQIQQVQQQPQQQQQSQQYAPAPSNLATITESGSTSASATPRSTIAVPFPEPIRQHALPPESEELALSARQLAEETGTPATGIYSQNGLWSDDSDEEEQRMSWRQRLSNSTSAGDRRSVKSSKSGTNSHRGSRSKMDSLISPMSNESPWPWSRKSTGEKHAPEVQEVLAGDANTGSNSVRNSNQGSIRSINQASIRHSGAMSPASNGSCTPMHQHTSSMHSVGSHHSASSVDMTIKQKMSLGRLRRKSTSKGGFNDFPEVVPAVPQIPAALESVMSVRTQSSGGTSRGSGGMPVTPASPTQKTISMPVMPASPTQKPVHMPVMPPSPTQRPQHMPVMPPSPTQRPQHMPVMPPSPTQRPQHMPVMPPSPTQRPQHMPVMPPSPTQRPQHMPVMPPSPTQRPQYVPVMPPSPTQKPLKAMASVKADPVNVSALSVSSSNSSLNKAAGFAQVRSSPSPTQMHPGPRLVPGPNRASVSSPAPNRNSVHSPAPNRGSMNSPAPNRGSMNSPAPNRASMNSPAPNRASMSSPKEKEAKERPKSFLKRGVERLWRSKSAHGLAGDFDALAPPPPPVPELPSGLRARNAASGLSVSQSSTVSTRREREPPAPPATLGRATISSPVANALSASAVFPMPPGAAPAPRPPSVASPPPPPPPPIAPGSPPPDDLAGHLAHLDQKYPSFSASVGVGGKAARSFVSIDPDEALETDPFASAYDYPAPPRRPASRVLSTHSGASTNRDSLLTLDEDVPRPWTPGLSSPSMRSLMPRLYKSKSFASGSRPSSMAMFFSKDKDHARAPPTPDLPQHTVIPAPTAVDAPPSPNPASSTATLAEPVPVPVQTPPADASAPMFYDNFENVPEEQEQEAEQEPEQPSRCASVTRGELAQVAQVFPAPPKAGPGGSLHGPAGERPERIVGPMDSLGGRVSVGGGTGTVPVPGGPRGQTRTPDLCQDQDQEDRVHAVRNPHPHPHPHPLNISTTHRHSSHSSEDQDQDVDTLAQRHHSASGSGSSLELATPHPNTHAPHFAPNAHPVNHHNNKPSRDSIISRPESTGSFQQLYDQLDINPDTLQPIHSFNAYPADDDASFCDPIPLSGFSINNNHHDLPPAVPFPEVENSPRLPSSEDYAFPIDIPSQPSSSHACGGDDTTEQQQQLATTPSRALKRMAVDYSLQRKGFNPRASAESPDSGSMNPHIPARTSSRPDGHGNGRYEQREAYQRLASGPSGPSVPSAPHGDSRSSSMGSSSNNTANQHHMQRRESQQRSRVRSGPEQWIDDMDTSSSENEQDETPLSQLHPAAAAHQQERRAASLARREARRAARERQLRSHKNQLSDGTLRPAAVWNGEGGVPADVLAGRLENVAISHSSGGSRTAQQPQPLRSQRSLRRPHRSSEHENTPSPGLSRATTLSSRPSRPNSARPLPHTDQQQGASQSHSRPTSSNPAAQQQQQQQQSSSSRTRARSHSIGSRHATAPSSGGAGGGDVPPLPRGRGTPVRCIVVADEIRQISLDVYPDTMARDILSQLRGKLPSASANASWVVCEVFTERALERQVRDYEPILSVVKGWDGSAANCLAIRESALTLARTVPETAPFVSGWCQLEVKPGKWNKRWLETRGGQVFLSKNDKGKEEVQLNTLFCDTYRPQQSQSYPAPQPFVFSIKRLEAASAFERPDEFLFTLASDESTGYKLHTAIYASRSFTIGTGNPAAVKPAASKGVSRSKSTLHRRREDALLEIGGAPSPFTGRGLLKHGH